MYLIFKYTTFVISAIICIYVSVLHRRGSKVSVSDNRTENKCVAAIDRLIHRMTELTDRWWPLLLFILFAVFCFTRFYALDRIPAGVHVDEIGYWYDAHNLAKYGTDRMGSRYPVLPASYGDGHNPLYCYMCMVMLKFFPFSVNLMRAVMGISAIPCFFASFGIVYQMYESRRWALLGPLFVTITPYIFAANRWGLNANQMLYVCTVILYFLIRALKYEKLRDYILAGIFFGISLLTYHLSYIMMPLFFILLFVYLMMVKRFKWKNAIGCFIPFAVIGMPTFLEQLVNLRVIEPFYLMGSDYPRLTSYRVGEIAPVNLIRNIGNIVTLLFGDKEFNYNSVKEFGTLYWAMIPLVFTGMIISVIILIRSVRNREQEILPVFLLYGISIYSGFISVIGCNAYKGNAIYICFMIFAVAGLRFIAGYSINDSRGAEAASEKVNGTDKDIPVSVSYGKHCEICVIILLAMLAFSFLIYSEFYFRRLTATYGFQSLFKSTEPGDMLKYTEKTYAQDGLKPIYMELNYDNRDFSGWMLALYLEIPYEEFNRYDDASEKLKREGASDAEVYRSVPLSNMRFAFPEEFDEPEDAVYILGSDWDHISGYLMSVGFECDTSFPGYKILYR